MSSTQTMIELAGSFVRMVETEDPDRISVSNIIDDTGKNRKTFYYHFMDKNHMIAWLFRYDLAHELEKRFDTKQLLFEKKSDDPCSKLPYYVFVKKGVRSLDGSDFLAALADTFQARRRFWSKVLRMKGSGNLQDYLYRLYLPAIENDVRFLLSNRHLKDKSISFLAEFYTRALVSFVTNRACDPSEKDILDGIGPFDNIVLASLENNIAEQQMRRALM